MTKKAHGAISVLFLLAALYDGGMGAVFLAAPGEVFRRCDVPPPNHMAYVQFPALLLIIFALMFLDIASNPLVNKRLIVYGILLKMAYCGVAFYYWFTAGIPTLWKPFAVIDVVTACLFAWAYVTLGKPQPHSVAA